MTRSARRRVIVCSVVATMAVGILISLSFAVPIRIFRYSLEKGCLVTRVTTRSVPLLPTPLFSVTTRQRMHVWPALPILIAGTLFLAWAIRRRRSEGHCDECAYLLTGVSSGVCPECGTPVPHSSGVKGAP